MCKLILPCCSTLLAEAALLAAADIQMRYVYYLFQLPEAEYYCSITHRAVEIH